MLDGASDGDVSGDAGTEECGGVAGGSAASACLYAGKGVVEPFASGNMPEGAVAGHVSGNRQAEIAAGQNGAVVARQEDHGAGTVDEIE